MGLTAGVNYKFPIAPEAMEDRSEFSEKLNTIGEVLQTFNYNQMFLCGSDGDYAGRKSYFETHGNFEVFDYYSAINEGYIAEDYKVWWGFEDKILYQVAKDKVTELASKDEPFNLTMLTVDTHFTQGYWCDLCKEEYDSNTANIIACADKQVSNFVNWCKQQDFYEDTVIVITGDHERMDKYLVDDAKNRTIYNCFINSQISDKSNIKNRIFSTLDMFPTILASMGYTWDGNMLGLGTNLFSNEQTLAEKMTFEVFNQEIAKRSQYYVDNFY